MRLSVVVVEFVFLDIHSCVLSNEIVPETCALNGQLIPAEIEAEVPSLRLHAKPSSWETVTASACVVE